MHTLTVRTGIAQFLHGIRTKRAQRWIARKGYLSLTQRRHDGALPQDPADLRFLYEAIVRQRPQRAIELGSGQSTIFIAQALHDVGAGHLWSLDADAGWLEHTRKMLPTHLQPFVTLVHSPVVVNHQYGAPAWEYSVIPDGEWDFLMIDGPMLTDEVRASCDLLHLASKVRPGARGFIDHRWRTANLAAEHVHDRLSLRYMPSLESFAIRAR